MAGVRTCEECGNKMPFGVRRRVVDGKKVCGGCAAGRPGRPLTNHQGAKVASTDEDLCPNCGEGEVEWKQSTHWPPKDFFVCPYCGVSGTDEDFSTWNDRRLGSRRMAAPTPPPFLQDPKVSGPKDGPITDLPDDGQVLPAGGGGGEAPPVPGKPMPGTTPNGGLGNFAPDRESDKVVRVCPFCGSGQIVGQSDGSIECGHEGVTFLVEVLPKHPFQPLVDEDGNPFEMTVEGDEKVPEIGVARAADQAGPQPVDEPVEDGGGDGGGEDEDLPDFLKGAALYVADDGTAMNEDAYVEHLAHRLFG